MLPINSFLYYIYFIEFFSVYEVVANTLWDQLQQRIRLRPVLPEFFFYFFKLNLFSCV
jgi:hypothetical protein